MDVTGFQFDAALAREFAAFGCAHVASDPNQNPSAPGSVEAMLSPDFPFYGQDENRHRHFIARCDGHVVGRVSAAIHPALQRSVGRRVGTLGLYECVLDGHVAGALLDAGVQWLLEQGADRVWGPMNFDIWHGYRFMIEGFGRARFLGEPCNMPYYPGQFTRYGFRPLRWWSSAEFEGIDALERLVAGYETIHGRFCDQGFVYRDADLHDLEKELRLLHAILLDAFSRFEGFTPIGPRDFASLLAPVRTALRSKLWTILHDPHGRPVAFVLSFAQPGCGVLYMGGKIRAADDVSGVGVAMFHHAVREIQRQAFGRMVIALMEEGNPFDRICRAARPVGLRRYALFEWAP